MEPSLLLIGAVLTALVGGSMALGSLMRLFFQKLRVTTLNALLCLYLPDGGYHLRQIGAQHDDKRQPFVLLVSRSAILFYPPSTDMRERLEFAPADLRWFSRPPNTHLNDHSDMILHFERGGRWYELTLHLRNYDGERLLDALETLALTLRPPSYHPYVHYGPVTGQPAQQAQTGEWTLLKSITLYLMPVYLVVLRDGLVERKIPVDSITHVASIPRLDAPGGVVRFRVAGEDLAFTLDDYEAFAVSLAEAAKRSLDAPLEVIERKGKKGKSEA
jgi:hypothetical protein